MKRFLRIFEGFGEVSSDKLNQDVNSTLSFSPLLLVLGM